MAVLVVLAGVLILVEGVGAYGQQRKSVPVDLTPNDPQSQFVEFDSVSEDLKRAARRHTAYWTARAPLHRENFAGGPDDNELDFDTVNGINASYILIDPNPNPNLKPNQSEPVIYYSQNSPVKPFLGYVKMLRRMVGEWMSRGWKVPRCLMMVGYDDLDRSRSEFSFVLKVASSRFKYSQSVLWPNFYDAYEFGFDDCGRSVDLGRLGPSSYEWKSRPSMPVFRGALSHHISFSERGDVQQDGRLFRDFDYLPRNYVVRYSQLHPDQLNGSWSKGSIGATPAILKHYGHPNEIPRDVYLTYKFPIVIHGYGTAFRLKEHLAAGACVILHDSNLEEWYYHLLKPYVHYVPLAHHMADLPKVLAWISTHPVETEQIGTNARLFYESYLRFEPATKYVHNLLTNLEHISTHVDMRAFAASKKMRKSYPLPKCSKPRETPAESQAQHTKPHSHKPRVSQLVEVGEGEWDAYSEGLLKLRTDGGEDEAGLGDRSFLDWAWEQSERP